MTTDATATAPEIATKTETGRMSDPATPPTVSIIVVSYNTREMTLECLRSVVAETQTAGRGRQGRNWVSQPGNLLVSVLFRPTLEALPFISIIGGVAAARAVRKVTGLEPQIKWPNDLLIHGRKVAGILAESAIAGDTVWYAVLGVGMNVSLNTDQTEEIASFATSVNAAAGKVVPREDLLRQFLMDLDALYLALGQDQSPIEEWQGLLSTTGQRLEATWGNESFIGVAEGTDPMGNLLLRQDDGSLLTLTAGDVTLGAN